MTEGTLNYVATPRTLNTSIGPSPATCQPVDVEQPGPALPTTDLDLIKQGETGAKAAKVKKKKKVSWKLFAMCCYIYILHLEMVYVSDTKYNQSSSILPTKVTFCQPFCCSVILVNCHLTFN